MTALSNRVLTSRGRATVAPRFSPEPPSPPTSPVNTICCGMDKKKSKEKKKSRTESDAAHPRFVLKPEEEEEMKKYEFEHHYFCNICKIYIAPTSLALKIHFKEEIKDHPPYGTCFYCKGDTFEYKFNGNIRYYHNCADYLAKK